MDTESLLRSLDAHDVRYVVIGAAAFPVHGYARATLDIDIFIEPTAQNAERTLAALGEVGYDVADLSVEDLLTKKVLIRQYILETDIHPFVAGVTFDEVWRNRVEDHIGHTPTNFAGFVNRRASRCRRFTWPGPDPLESAATFFPEDRASHRSMIDWQITPAPSAWKGRTDFRHTPGVRPSGPRVAVAGGGGGRVKQGATQTRRRKPHVPSAMCQ